jgi:PIN domain-containing protein
MSDQDGPEPASSRSHLETEFVFLDTQTYVANAFDWSGSHFAKLVELAHDGTVKLLITSVTRREVRRKIEESLDQTLERIRTCKTSLRNAGLNVEILSNRSKMLDNALREFDAFLDRVQVVELPLEASLDGILDDYFALRPPFSEKKRDEFPDAVVAASLKAWGRRHRKSAYVVSGDRDFEAVCANDSSLIHVKSVSEIISRASVSAEIHRVLATAVDNSEYVKDKLADALVGREARTSRRPVSVKGRVDAAKILGILSVNVIESDPPRFVCEVEFESDLSISLNVSEEFDEGWRNVLDDFEFEQYRSRHMRGVTLTRSFIAEVELNFDPALREELSVESVWVGGDVVEIERDDLPFSRF